ncbi:hypothetical protein IV417_11490 [Alphaproteobacteria bacterium KMM 3653]|uniref:Uncharacterized protein n=1 Tax=Harenicola maris TaxID=2841044 RepID=A0AAP2CQU8_9RHOB|nr:hypothetical protein [Harenicola maris]
MSFLRPTVENALRRWSEVLVMFAVAAFGLWVFLRGGYIFQGLGVLIVIAAFAFGLAAWRRMQFRMAVDAPGLVEVVEGRVSYLGPYFGGSVDLGDLQELQVLDVAGRRRCWRLKQNDGQALLIPFAAEGAAALYDAFVLLPGLRGAALSGAASRPASDPVTIWRASAR